jgi:hypothetical protein
MQTAEATGVAAVANAPDRQPLPYRTAFETRLDLREVTEQVRGQLRIWLRDKGLDVGRFDSHEPGIGPGVSLFYLSTHTVSGWRLTERTAGGVTWVSTVAATRGDDHRGTTWVSLNVEATAPTGNAPQPAPPRLIRLLLGALDAYDGEALLRECPTVVPEPRVEQLLDIVCAENRRLPVVIAAPPLDVGFEQWRATVAELTRDLPGLATIYLLDPVAARAFNDGIGSTHRIGPGAVRTYLPDVDPAVVDDAVRHRVLGRRRIESEPRRARWALAALPRQLAASSLPARAARGLDLSLRDFTRDRASAAAPDGLTEFRAEVKLLTELLETADDSERQLNETIAGLRDALLDVTGELEVARDELETRDATVRALRRRLIAANQFAAAHSPAEEQTELPKSFADLLDRMGELAPFVVFTGDRDPSLDLDERPQSSTWAQTAWQGLLALRDYARTRQTLGFDGDFKRWCESPVDEGRAVPPGKVALGESDTVRHSRKLSRMRQFRVPEAVEATGWMFMPAHLRLGQSSTVAPRMHFHDASTSHHTIYVGYIGRHLANTQTS